MTKKDEFVAMAEKKGITLDMLQNWKEQVNLTDFVGDLDHDPKFRQAFRAAVEEASNTPDDAGLSMLFPETP